MNRMQKALLMLLPLLGHAQKNSDLAPTLSSAVSNNSVAFVVGKIYVVPPTNQPVKKEARAVDVDRLIVIYPNPVTDMLYFETPDKAALTKVVVYSTEGKVIYTGKPENNSLNLSLLAAGVYYLQLDETVTRYKIIKK